MTTATTSILTVQGTILDIKFQNENGWGIFTINTPSGYRYVLKGTLLKAEVGDYVEAQGSVTSDKWGTHIKCNSIFQTMPKSTEAIAKFLASLPGIGEVTARHIVDKHGQEAVDRILQDPYGALEGIPRINPHTIEKIHNYLLEKGNNLQAIQELTALGYGPDMQTRIFEHFKESTLRVIQENPYKLLDVSRIGFNSLDVKILSRGKIKANDPVRWEAAVKAALYQACNINGDTYLTREEIRAALQQLKVDVPLDKEDDLYSRLVKAHEIISIEDSDPANPRFAHPMFYYFEQNIAIHMGHLLKAKLVPMPPKLSSDLNENQVKAVKNALNNGVSILTGGPGTGKTFTLKSILDSLNTENVVMVAPTGKAAKRMTEATGYKAVTMHSWLYRLMKGGTFPTDANVIIDETSMVGVDLMSQFLEYANRPNRPIKRLIMVGDDDQLPSISPGAVLQDSIQSGVIPTVKLTQVMRQSEGSLIARNAQQVRQGLPLLYPEKGTPSDFPVSPSKHGVDFFLKNLLRIPSLPRDGASYNLMTDVQILSPIYAGEWGCDNINRILQDTLNPPSTQKDELTIGLKDKTTYRVGDKVIITQNNSELDVVNGDIGNIVSIQNRGNFQMEVNFDDDRGDVTFKGKELNTVKLAYCITIHKAQGSEAPFVVCLFPKSVPPMMRARNLLYTAITRAREKCWLIEDPYTIKECLANDSPNKRNTTLKKKVSDYVNGVKPLPEPELPPPDEDWSYRCMT